MKVSPSSFAIAVLAVGLVIGGTGGAIAATQIGTRDIKNGAVTTPKLHNNAVTSSKISNGTVTTADLATSARGAKTVQYVASGAGIATNSVTVHLPGTWTAAKLAQGSWSVQLVRNGPPTYLFSLGQSANAGEGTSDGFYINVDTSGVASVFINASDYGGIDTIRVTQSIASTSATSTASRVGASSGARHTR